jgi:hypothetical protein
LKNLKSEFKYTYTIKFAIFGMFIFTQNAIGQYYRDSASVRIYTFSNSFGDKLLEEFISDFNKDTLDFSKLLKNNYFLYQTVLSESGKIYPNFGFENEHRNFQNDKRAFETSLTFTKSCARLYFSNIKKLQRQKKRTKILFKSDFLLKENEWTGYSYQFKNTWRVTYINTNKSSAIKALSFIVMSDFDIPEHFYSVTILNPEWSHLKVQSGKLKTVD